MSRGSAAVPRRAQQTLRTLAAVMVPVVAAFTVYLPVTGAYFLGDDFVHLIEVVNWPLGSVLWRPYMGHLYVLPTLVYWALWHTVGMRAEVYYGFVLTVHLVNVALFFAVARALTGSVRIASLGALAWGTCPLHEGALAWFCVHGHALAGTALLCALYGLARATADQRPVSLTTAALSGLALFAGSLCFGTGIAVAVVFPVAALVCGGRRVGRGPLLVMVATAVAVVAVYAAAHVVYRLTPGPRPIPGVMRSLAAPLVPLTTTMHLAGVGLSTLVAGLAWAPISYPSPGALLLASAAALTILAGAILASPGRRRWFLGLLVLAAATYGLVAIGRAAAMLIFPHLSEVRLASALRYHYVASIPMALAITLAGATLAARWRAGSAARDGLYAAVCAAWLVAFGTSDWHMDLHPRAYDDVERVLDEVLTQTENAPVGATIYLRDRRFNPSYLWNRGFTSAGVFTLFLDSDELAGRRIRYVADPVWSPKRPPSGSLLARLLVDRPPPAQ